MPALMKQITGLSMYDQMQIMKYLIISIEKAVSAAEKTATPKRTLTPDALLMGAEITEHDVSDDCSGCVENPWAKYCGCISKKESAALKAYVSAQDVVDEESWK